MKNYCITLIWNVRKKCENHTSEIESVTSRELIEYALMIAKATVSLSFRTHQDMDREKGPLPARNKLVAKSWNTNTSALGLTHSSRYT